MAKNNKAHNTRTFKSNWSIDKSEYWHNSEIKIYSSSVEPDILYLCYWDTHTMLSDSLSEQILREIDNEMLQSMGVERPKKYIHPVIFGIPILPDYENFITIQYVKMNEEEFFLRKLEGTVTYEDIYENEDIECVKVKAPSYWVNVVFGNYI